MLSPFQDALFFAPAINDVDMQNDHTTAQVSVSFIENVEFDAPSNIERWQKQLSPNINDVSVHKVLVTTNLGDWNFFKLKHETQAMYVAVQESFEGSLFLKMVGKASTVQEQAEVRGPEPLGRLPDPPGRCADAPCRNQRSKLLRPLLDERLRPRGWFSFRVRHGGLP